MSVDEEQAPTISAEAAETVAIAADDNSGTVVVEEEEEEQSKEEEEAEEQTAEEEEELERQEVTKDAEESSNDAKRFSTSLYAAAAETTPNTANESATRSSTSGAPRKEGSIQDTAAEEGEEGKPRATRPGAVAVPGPRQQQRPPSSPPVESSLRQENTKVAAQAASQASLSIEGDHATVEQKSAAVVVAVGAPVIISGREKRNALSVADALPIAASLPLESFSGVRNERGDDALSTENESNGMPSQPTKASSAYRPRVPSPPLPPSLFSSVSIQEVPAYRSSQSHTAGPIAQRGEQGDNYSGRSHSENHDKSSNPLPRAQPYEEPPLISAELVPSSSSRNPVLAVPVVYDVELDGDNPTANHSVSTHPTNTNRDRSGNENGRAGQEEGFLKVIRRHPRWRLWLAALIALFIGLAAGMTVLGVLVASANKNDAEGTEQQTNFPYPCFTSTLDILTYQIEADEDELMNDENPIIICPNTRIRLGRFKNPSLLDLEIIDGDHPINVVRPNVTIQCGLDGKRSNNCILEDGLVHVITTRDYHHPSYGTIQAASSIDGFTLRGVTFSGVIRGSGQIGGISVAISQPAKDIHFHDCAWINYVASKRAIWVGPNLLMERQANPLADLSIELTVSNSLFQDVVYEEQLIASFNQAIHLKNVTFRDVRLANLLTSGCGVHPRGCRNLLDCGSTVMASSQVGPELRGVNDCSVENICVENVDTTGAAPIVISNQTRWASSGINIWYGPIEFDQLDSLPETDDFCPLGLALYDANFDNYECVDPPVFRLSSEGGCP